MLTVGLLSGSPGNALNAKVLKSDDSINEREVIIVAPVCAAVPVAPESPAIIATTGGGVEIQ